MATITFQALTRDDFGLLADWLARPHVQRWWHHEFTAEAIERDFGAAVDGVEPTELLTVLLGERPVGMLQAYRIADYPEYVAELSPSLDVPAGAASIDYFLGEADVVGRGVGQAMLRAAARRIWTYTPPVSCLIVPVNSANVASWTALLRAGFQLVARADLEPDNPVDARLHEILRLDRSAAVSSRRAAAPPAPDAAAR